MPREDNGKPKRRPGRPRIRAFYNRFSFHLSHETHQKMKELARERCVFLEDVYSEAISRFLNMPERGLDYQYSKAPPQGQAKAVTISMEEDLAQSIRHLAIDARVTLGDIAETAARLYLQEPS